MSIDAPSNTNFLNSFQFKFVIDKLPHINYFIQGVTLPGLQINPVSSPNPNVPIKLQGDTLRFDDLVIRFGLNEELTAWSDTQAWMRGISFPTDSQEYRDLYNNKIVPNPFEPPRKQGHIYSDCSLIVLSSHSNPIYEFKFFDAWPTNLSPIEFSTTESDTVNLTASVTLSYTQYILMNITA